MKKNIETAKERIINLAEKWYILEPLYFLIWSTHEFIINTAIQTIRTARGIIEYNPNFINSLSDDDLHEVIKIEIIRILLKHPYSRQREIPTMSYLTSNITIAEYCDIKVPLPKASTIFGSDKYNLKHFEFYYYKLLEQSPVQNTGMEERKQTKNNDSLNQDPDTTVDEETQVRNEASASSSKPTQDKKMILKRQATKIHRAMIMMNSPTTPLLITPVAQVLKWMQKIRTS